MTITSIRGCVLAAGLAAASAAFAQGAPGAPSAARLGSNPGIGAPQPGSALPAEVTTRGSGAGASLPAAGSSGDTRPDTIVIDPRGRQGGAGRPRAEAGPHGAIRIAQSGSGTGNAAGGSATGGATSTGGGAAPTAPNRTGVAGSTGGMTPGGGAATSGTGQNARAGGGVSGASSTGSGNLPR